jgi:hypothetical protein
MTTTKRFRFFCAAPALFENVGGEGFEFIVGIFALLPSPLQNE